MVRFGLHCYGAGFQPLPADEARKACQGMGGDLVSVTDIYVLDTLVGMAFDGQYWIGYSDAVFEGIFI